MIEFCPRCNYSFYDYLKRGIDPTDCPHCHFDLRGYGYESWQVTCPECGVDILEYSKHEREVYGKELEKCPFCYSDITPKAEKFSPSVKKCPYCKETMENLVVDGIINFRTVAKKDSKDYVVFGAVPGNFEIQVKCSNCNAILNNEMEGDYFSLQSRMLRNFKIGDF